MPTNHCRHCDGALKVQVWEGGRSWLSNWWRPTLVVCPGCNGTDVARDVKQPAAPLPPPLAHETALQYDLRTKGRHQFRLPYAVRYVMSEAKATAVAMVRRGDTEFYELANGVCWPILGCQVETQDAPLPPLTDDPDVDQLKTLDAEIRSLVAAGWRHRKGFRLADADHAQALRHLEEEIDEYAEAQESGDVANVHEELADMLAIVLHLGIMDGVSIGALSRMARQKLRIRFYPPEPATS
jgi:NTP pyrophosphatase (non-canonical NTP hydrolase)